MSPGNNNHHANVDDDGDDQGVVHLSQFLRAARRVVIVIFPRPCISTNLRSETTTTTAFTVKKKCSQSSQKESLYNVDIAYYMKKKYVKAL